MKKNVSGQKIGAQLVSATDGSAFTGSVTVYVTGDAGTQAVGSVGSGACTHEGNGYHTYAPAQAETNYDLVAFTFVGTGAVPVTLQTYTTFPQTGDSYPLLGSPLTGTISGDQLYIINLQSLVATVIDTVTSQTVFTILSGSPDDDAYNGCVIVVTDQSTATQKCIGQVADYVGSTKQVTLAADPGIFTIAVGDIVTIRIPASFGPEEMADLDAIKAVTDAIPFSSAGNVQADVQEINEATITGDGDGTPFDVA